MQAPAAHNFRRVCYSKEWDNEYGNWDTQKLHLQTAAMWRVAYALVQISHIWLEAQSFRFQICYTSATYLLSSLLFLAAGCHFYATLLGTTYSTRMYSSVTQKQLFSFKLTYRLPLERWAVICSFYVMYSCLSIWSLVQIFPDSLW